MGIGWSDRELWKKEARTGDEQLLRSASIARLAHL